MKKSSMKFKALQEVRRRRKMKFWRRRGENRRPCWRKRRYSILLWVLDDIKVIFISLKQGNVLFKEGKFELAVECYTMAMELDPLSAVMPANRALALLKLER